MGNTDTHRDTSTLQPNHSALDKGKKAATGRLRKSQFQTPQVPKRITLKYVMTQYSTAYGKSITSLNLKTKTWQVWCRNNQEQRFSLDYGGPRVLNTINHHSRQWEAMLTLIPNLNI